MHAYNYVIPQCYIPNAKNIDAMVLYSIGLNDTDVEELKKRAES